MPPARTVTVHACTPLGYPWCARTLADVQARGEAMTAVPGDATCEPCRAALERLDAMASRARRDLAAR